MKTLDINGGMTIYEAEHLKTELQQALAEAQYLTVNLTAVSEIDTTGLQLLLALKRLSNVTLINHSHCIQQLADLLQLHAALGAGARS